AFLDVSSIGICRTPTVTGQMANSVELVAFGSTWTIMVIVAFRTQRLRSDVMFLLLVPCCDLHAYTFLEHNSMNQSCGSCVVAAATVEIPAAVLAVLKPERLKVDKARNE
nr:hypothetical protein [Tanacetum cinerariifolium]